MKKTKLLYMSLFVLMMYSITGCETDNGVNVDDVSKETIVSIEDGDAVVDELVAIFEEIYTDEEFSSLAYKIEKRDRYLPECAVKTVTTEAGVKNVIIDFGEGCTLKNDKILKGKLLMTYTIDKSLRNKSVTHGYEDFFINDKQISGESSSVKVGSNENGNRQTTFTESILISWESGETASREGTRVTELISGGTQDDWASKVYEISGNWTSTSKNGEVHSVEITQKLRKELTCRFIVSGVKEISKTNKTGTLDFGDGSCDAIATFTDADGVVEEIELQKNKRK
ncbi:hypothetical protein [Flavicella marina]|uniref:hypothetical protein n=1 Tax=Flavicella marina TaxID=1475951 RepID=UPI00126550D5|nr:hypothetical protein [Flavicella marina]